MSLLQSTVTPLFYVFSLVSCVSSHTLATPTEVTVTEIVKNNDFYDIMMSVPPQRVNMDYIDEGQKNTRVKRSRVQLAEAARLPMDKMGGLVLAGFANLVSNQPSIGAFESRFINDGKPPVKITDAANFFADMIKGAVKILNRRKLYFESIQ